MKNACVVGYGAVGPIHASALDKSPDARLYAICDINPEKLKSTEYDVVKYTNFEQVLNDKSINVIHICTPHYLHKDMAVKALAAGKDIVLEKPVTMTESELDELLNFKTDRKICVMLQNRTNKCLERLYDIVKNDKAAGKMLGICGFLTWQRTPEYYSSDGWRGKWSTEGGGLLINQAVHTLDIINWLGGGAKSIHASISTKKLSQYIEVEDTADALISLKNGTSAMFYATNCYSTNSPMRIEVKFENVLYRYADERLYKITDDNIEIIEDDKNNPLGKRYWGSGHANVINNFYSFLSGKGGNYTDLKDSASTMRLLFAFYKSAKENGKEIAIKE